MEQSRRPVLSRIRKSCHGELYSLNLLESCPCGCIHCRYSALQQPLAAPNPQLPALLGRELERKARRSNRPAFILVGTSCEPFSGSNEIQRVAIKCLRLLLERRVGVSLETRGRIPAEAMQLFTLHRESVRVRVAIPSIDSNILDTWEPGCADVETRIFNLQQLRRAGIPAMMHIGPIIPFINDGAEHYKELLDTASDLHCRRVTTSIFRPYRGAREVLESTAAGTGALVLSSYLDRTNYPPRPRRILPVEKRSKIYEEMRGIARKKALSVGVCRCDDEDLGTPPCSLGFGISRRAVRKVGTGKFPTVPSSSQHTASSPRIRQRDRSRSLFPDED